MLQEEVFGVKKIFKRIFYGILIAIGILFIIGIFVPGEITIKGESGQTDDLSLYSGSFISDENYEPTEKDLLGHTISVLNHLDKHEWENVDNYFLSSYVQETELADVYGAWETDPEDIVSVNYIVENKQYTAFLEELEVSPISVDYTNGVEWSTFPYDVWVDFSFELTRVIELENEKIKKDKFEIMGNYPPLWNSNTDVTRWYLGSLMLRPIDPPLN